MTVKIYRMIVFVIKHKSGRKYIHPRGGSSNPDNNTGLVLHEDRHDRMHWTFDIEEGIWGYIRHVASGKIFHPYGGQLFPGNDTDVVLHSDRHAGALFALDDVNNWVVHKGGKFLHPKGGSPNPGNETSIVLHGDKHDAMRFLFVNARNIHEEVMVYGKPTVGGSWKIINSVLNPLADHVFSMTYKVGKSKTESTESSVTFSWGISASANFIFGSASASSSMAMMAKRSSSSTWREETTKTREITIKPGESVVTWQFVFAGELHGNKATFRSNILADTRSPEDVPDEWQGSSF